VAKRQSRRAVSLSRPAYVAASIEALRRSVTLSQLVTDALRAYGVEIEETDHQSVEVAQIAKERRTWRVKWRTTLSAFNETRLTNSYLRILRDGPIRRALGDAHADACGEKRWVEKRSV
jgi:hypothetical protein